MYAINLKLIPIIFLMGISITVMIFRCIPETCHRLVSLVLSLIAIYLILKYTVIGRAVSVAHKFVFLAPYSNEFWREMVMNIVLYFPFGLFLPYLLKLSSYSVYSYLYSVLCSFILSVSIEAYQYYTGTGLAQGTDIIMNTLGTALGGLSYVWSSWMVKIGADTT